MADLGAIGILDPIGGVQWGASISGVVLDQNMNPVSRTIRAYHRASGQLSGGAVSDPVYGAYTIHLNMTYGKEQHTVVEFDDDAGESHNARVFDRITPL